MGVISQEQISLFFSVACMGANWIHYFCSSKAVPTCLKLQEGILVLSTGRSSLFDGVFYR